MSPRSRKGGARHPLLLSAVLLLSGCPSGPEGPPPGRPPAPILTAQAVRKDIPVVLEAFGNVEACETIEIKAQVGGLLRKVHFVEGGEVRSGDILFSIDPRLYEAMLKQAEAMLARDEAQLVNARREAQRLKDLVSGAYASAEESEHAAAAAEALEATVRADQASVDIARIQLGHCTIRSPVDGRTGRLLVYAGNLVKANADTPLVVLTRMEPVHVAFAVPEKELPRIRELQAAGPLKVEVTVPSAPPVLGDLEFINNTVDVATGTIALEALFPNRDRLLWPGQYVTVRLRLKDIQGALTVPTQAVQTGQKGSFVFIVKEDDTAEMRPVTLLQAAGAETAVEGDLEAGETVVLEGQLQVVPGGKVERKGAAGTGTPGSGASPRP